MVALNRTSLTGQFAWYLIVGGLAFSVDIGCFVFLRQLAFPVIPSSVASLITATLANYFLSYLLAFARGRFGRPQEVTRFFAVALMGLGMNTLIVWLLITFTATLPTAAKVIAVPFVLGWNFFGRRWFVFRPDVPALTYGLTNAVVKSLKMEMRGG